MEEGGGEQRQKRGEEGGGEQRQKRGEEGGGGEDMEKVRSAKNGRREGFGKGEEGWRKGKRV